MKNRAALALLVALSSCTLEAPEVPGPKGDMGDAGISPWEECDGGICFNSGQVGIGTKAKAPRGKLDVELDGQVGAVIGRWGSVVPSELDRSTLLLGPRPDGDSAAALQFQLDSDNKAQIQFSGPNGGMFIETFNANKPGWNGIQLFLKGDGKIGMGTSDPANDFDIRRGNGVAMSLGNSNASRFVTLYSGDDANKNATILWDKDASLSLGPSPNSNIGSAAITSRVHISSAGMVGIGTTDPPNKLSVAGAIAVGVGIGTTNITGGSDNNVLVHGRSSSVKTTSGIQFGDNDSSDARQFAIINGNDGTYNGNDGTSPQAGNLFFVAANGPNVDPVSQSGFVVMKINAVSSPGITVYGTALKPGGGSWGDSSDARLKQNIAPLASSLARLLRLHGVTYEWLEPAKHGHLTGTQIGMIAQQVEEVFPDWVSTDPQGYKTLSIRGFEALTVESLRELKTENDRLSTRNAELTTTVDQMKTQLSALPEVERQLKTEREARLALEARLQALEAKFSQIAAAPPKR